MKLKKLMIIPVVAASTALTASAASAQEYGADASYGAGDGFGGAAGGAGELAFTGVETADVALAGALVLGAGLVVLATQKRKTAQA